MTDPAKVGNFHCVGSVNCRFIEEFLSNENIPLIAADLGGLEGRVIYFDNRDKGVFVRKIKKQQSLAIAERDRKAWKTSVWQHNNTDTGIDLWL